LDIEGFVLNVEIAEVGKSWTISKSIQRSKGINTQGEMMRRQGLYKVCQCLRGKCRDSTKYAQEWMYEGCCRGSTKYTTGTE
jgi:hypothetical protein